MAAHKATYREFTEPFSSPQGPWSSYQYIVECTCGWSTITAVANHADLLAGQHEHRYNTAPTTQTADTEEVPA